MTVLTALSVLLGALILALGAAKLLALAPMRELAAHAGFSVLADRGIGALKVAGGGILFGLAVPMLGGQAAVGLLLVLAGAYLVVLVTTS